MRTLSRYALLLAPLLGMLPWTVAQSSDDTALLATLPSCALTCLVTAIGESPCAATNQTCICTNEDLQTDMTLCVTQNCTITQALFTKNVTNTVCGVPIRDRSAPYNVMNITLGTVSGVVVLIRLVFRALVSQVDLGLDDWFILITLLSGIPQTVIVSHGTIPNGLGKDVWTLTPEKITNFGRFFYIMAVLYFLLVMLLKMSLLFFYLRIFPDRLIRRLLWGTVIVNSVVGVLFAVMAIFQCHPISYVWTKWDGEHHGTCLNINGISWANAIISICLDIWMLAIPLWQLRSLNLNWKKKVGVGIMFATGAFVTVVSILRLQSLVSFANSENATQDNYNVSSWSTIEINVGVICACMPTLRLIAVRLVPALASTRSGGPYYDASASKSGGGVRSRIRSRNTRTGTGTEPEEVGHPGILRRQEYTVQYGDSGDESSLVQLRDFESKAHATRTNVSDVSA
ncbi:CFEM domain-containing protein [Pleurostoma richardsiae]|uniref:CFEM domain-containing protein n=1 Tax=Pleurostoma richardsiae TaxID=41990 RepID=A0AA38R5U2_9PEZI|nr:CFEM domain-containing protein [Pleurostoma richardsiae]